MKPWPTSPTNGRRLPADEITDITVRTLTRLVHRLGSMAWVTGMGWYYNAHAIAVELGEKHGLSTDRIAAMIAALSPRCNWESNLDDTILMLEDGPDNGFFAFDANVGKADCIRDGWDIDATLGGRKVRAFYRNIADPYGSLDVTLDSWMGRALTLPAIGVHEEQGYLKRAGVYDAISDGFRVMAERHAVMPHQLQAAIWLDARGIESA